ncbi:hypothetical protein JIN85_06505 [Luteolibacter pohnpeiensis]|uniref:Uncharacterized protein n=1 Tax=Luteolibacter pohnpeiensis TaxID=454153 RepID=A0A934S545_9BACT|nr:hypothetical protein [Luteolibacter pohnpeiensis]MBK1882058.1 hypothetical protein [Luteolibacter pohnpeiensis]
MITVHTNHRNFQLDLLNERLPSGVSLVNLANPLGIQNDGNHTVEFEVDFRYTSPTAFALWILRKLRSIPGNHALVIHEENICLEMPEAIDLVARAVTRQSHVAA